MASGRLPVSSRNWQSLSMFQHSKKMSLLRKFDEDAVSEIDDEDEDEGGTHESDDSAKYPTLFMHLTSMYVWARILPFLCSLTEIPLPTRIMSLPDFSAASEVARHTSTRAQK